MAPKLAKRGMVLLLILLLVMGTGCGLMKKKETPPKDAKAKTEEQKSSQDKTPKSATAEDELEDQEGLEGEDYNYELDELVFLERERPLYGPLEHQHRVDVISAVITSFLENMKTGQIEEAKLYLYGEEHQGHPITFGQLQKEIEALHPVSWRLDKYRPVEPNNILATVTITWPNDDIRQMQPFNMQLGEDNNWYIHFNSFADSFHTIARPLMKEHQR